VRPIRAYARPRGAILPGEPNIRATDLLEKQHRKVEATLKKLESGKVNVRALVI
jgi:hypothetical protein